ncbi:DUF2850 domain-containing protein [Vibrio azureus]|uniref:DUF2850 domain-containing protein n=1 Tax=Vibrio azureus NBRC 104587 TaxID=1219077 RepID=U3A3I9_9VIBR|nr:DUF2850 domain-containing protein [Vibrio azureus]GAD74576.1 hypothetical protein VAZ01S_012_00570 [Vibrio azureus NBRC 104587]
MTRATHKAESKPYLHSLSSNKQPYYWKMLGVVIFCLVIAAILKVGIGAYSNFIAPNNVYGQWVEIDAPPSQTERLTLSPEGVFRNDRLIATQFDFDGTFITINHSIGESIYKLSGSYVSPQLHRITPPLPRQRFTLKSEQDAKVDSASSSQVQRRAALSEHFSAQ